MLDDVTDFCRLFLLRHPELDSEARSRAVGSGECGLSRRGKARVLAWIKLLEGQPLDEIHCSDQPQAAHPANGLAQAISLEARTSEALRDQDMGLWQGRLWEDLLSEDPDRVKEFFANFAEVVPPEGESLGQAVERVMGWWNDAGKNFAGKTIAIVGPGSVLSGFTAAMLGMRLSRCISLHLPHGGVGVLDVFANGVRLAAWNIDALSDQ